jgi:lipopolysaccharide/colanic/teichoic acid biosynthesis glycosyltransferase
MMSRKPLIAPPYRRSRTRRLTDLARRFLNVLVALVAMVAMAPLMLIIAVLVRLDSPGPVIYRQVRVGLNRRRRRGLGSKNGRRQTDRGGRIFTILKFRTMREDAEAGQVWAARNDPRVTKAGRFLRATRLDELPQLVNVLKGDMNIVGPRPEQPEIFAELRSELPSYRRRQRVLPGITGLAQVNRGYDASLDDVRRKVELDLEYIDRRSALQDLTIMARTMPVMVLGLWGLPGPGP